MEYVTKITVYNSICELANLPSDLEVVLKKELRYLNQSVSFSFAKCVKELERISLTLDDTRFKISSQDRQDMLKRRGFLKHQMTALQKDLYVSLYVNGQFPTGLLPRVLKLLEIHKSQIMISDMRKEPKKLQHKFVNKKSFPPLRYYQKTANRMVMEKGRGIIVAPTGTGKTLTVAKMIWELGVKTLVITPGKAITDNMVDTLTEYFGKGQVAKLTTKSKKLKAINVVNIQALVKINPKVLEGIDAIFIDEFHHAAAETYQEINMNHLKNVFFRIGLTATNFRNDGADIALEAVLSEVLYEYSIPQAIKDGFLVKPTFSIQDSSAEPHGNYQKEYKEGIVNNEDRNNHIAEIVEYHKKDSVLVLIQQVEHGEALKAMIPGSEFISGQENDTVRKRLFEDFRSGKIKCLIGTSVIGEGVDLPCAKVLIMAGGGKARSQIMQNVGRVLRPLKGKDEAIVYDFTDEGSKHLSKHSLERQEIYQQYEIQL